MAKKALSITATSPSTTVTSPGDASTDARRLAAEMVRNSILQNYDAVSREYVSVGHLLSQFRDGGMALDLGHPSFRVAVQVEFGMKPRKAHYLCTISDAITANGISVAEATAPGWTKAALVCSVEGISGDDLRLWLKKAVSLSVSELKSALDNAFPSSKKKAKATKVVSNHPIFDRVTSYVGQDGVTYTKVTLDFTQEELDLVVDAVTLGAKMSKSSRPEKAVGLAAATFVSSLGGSTTILPFVERLAADGVIELDVTDDPDEAEIGALPSEVADSAADSMLNGLS